MGGVENIEHNGKILAVVIRAEINKELESSGEKLKFATPDNFPFQVGFHNWNEGLVIKPHFHNPFKELKNFPVQEFFYLISGKVRIDLYDDRKNDAKVSEIFVNEGDSVILNTGHGMESLGPAKLLELKQGPYRGRDVEKRFLVNNHA